MVIRFYLQTLFFTVCLLVDSLVAYPKGRDMIDFTQKFDFSNPSQSDTSGIVRIYDSLMGTMCSAFVVDKSYAITAAHCINSLGKLPSHPIYVFANRSFDSEYIEVKAVGYDNYRDVGILMGNFSSFKPLKINFNKEYKDFKVMTACGYAGGNNFYICTRLETTGRVVHLIRAWGKIIPGMSGGPAIDKDTGEVVAIISQYDALGYGYVVPLREFLNVFTKLRD